MDEAIRKRYHEAVLETAMARYGILPGQIRALDAYESFIYAFSRDGDDFILRLSHSLRRTEALIQGEVDWINYLAAGGVPVARAVDSQQGRLVEPIADGQGGEFLATAFERAPGQSPWELGWTPERYTTYGRLLGRLHALTANYRLPNPAWRRPEWDDPQFDFVHHYLPASETYARQQYRALCDHLNKLPKDPGCYGLIHQDAHEGNLLMDASGNLTLIDFDDCGYSWYANDLAIVLFYISMGVADVVSFTRDFLTHFLSGYRQEYSLEPGWLAEFPAFLKLRELELYGVIHRDFDVQAIEDPWVARFMRGRKARIEADAPVIDFDFSQLAG